jgi:hypothetical protein
MEAAVERILVAAAAGQVFSFEQPNPPKKGGDTPITPPGQQFRLQGARRLGWGWAPRALTQTRLPGERWEQKASSWNVQIAFSDKLLTFKLKERIKVVSFLRVRLNGSSMI